MIPISWPTLLLAILVIGQQQQVARAWWFLEPAEPTKPAAPGSTAAPLASTSGLRATAQFDMDGVKGFMKFSQANEAAPTYIEYDLTGLKGNNRNYHVHVRPVPKFEPAAVKSNATARGQLCADPATGGHLNPHHVTQKLPPASAPHDKYETGDLSGKHGPLQVEPTRADHYAGRLTDDKLPMSGPNSIVGRSIVIHKNDGARWVCATIEPQQ